MTSPSEYPRVTTILKEMVLFDQETWWLKSKYLRRGRLVDACASIIASGKEIEPDWFKSHSGEADDDRVEHEECRPYLDGVRAFMAEHRFVLEASQMEVINSVERYLGHLDWLGYFEPMSNVKWVIDMKCGPPPPEYVTMPRRINPLYVAYRRQVALYKLALATQTGVVANRATLHLFEGRYQFIRHNDVRDVNAALAMVRAFHDRQQFRGV
jgi:hypothetical protein